MFVIVSRCVFCSDVIRYKRYSDPAIVVAVDIFPWIVHGNTSGSCTAVLISNKHVLIPGHCLKNVPPHGFEIEFLNKSGNYKKKAVRYIKHPNYNTVLSKHDIALIEIEPLLQPISVPEIDFNVTCPDLFIEHPAPLAAGYTGSGILKQVSLEWLDPCDEELFSLTYPGAAQAGDSGAPLFYYKNNMTYLLGVHRSSFRSNGRPIRYVSLSYNADFINRHINLTKVYDGTTTDYTVYGLSLNLENWSEASAVSATSTTSTILTTSATPATSAVSTTPVINLLFSTILYIALSQLQ